MSSATAWFVTLLTTNRPDYSSTSSSQANMSIAGRAILMIDTKLETWEYTMMKDKDDRPDDAEEPSGPQELPPMASVNMDLPPAPVPLPDMDSIPSIPEDPMMREQGTVMDCIYCTKVYPELEGAECPKCGGRGPTFRAARMMDRQTSAREIWPRILGLYETESKLESLSPEQVQQYRDRLIGVLDQVNLYQFDMKEALLVRIHDLDMEFDIDPKTGSLQQ